MGFIARTAAAAVITVLTIKLVNHLEAEYKAGKLKLPCTGKK